MGHLLLIDNRKFGYTDMHLLGENAIILLISSTEIRHKGQSLNIGKTLKVCFVLFRGITIHYMLYINTSSTTYIRYPSMCIPKYVHLTFGVVNANIGLFIITSRFPTSCSYMNFNSQEDHKLKH